MTISKYHSRRYSLRQGHTRQCDAAMILIIETVAMHHGLSREDLEGPRRFPHFVTARNEAMAAIYATGLYGLVAVGSFFGCRDHATVHRGIRKHQGRPYVKIRRAA